MDPLIKDETWVSWKKPTGFGQVPNIHDRLEAKKIQKVRSCYFQSSARKLENSQDDIVFVMELYAPIICTELVGTVFTSVIEKGWSIRRVDFKGVFLNAYLDIKE